MVDAETMEAVETPDMPEPENNFQNWALGVIGALVVVGIGSGIGMAIASSGHFARLDTIIEIQSKQHEEDKGKLDKIYEKIDALPKLETLAALSHRVEVVEALQAGGTLELTRQQQNITDNRRDANSRMDSLESKINIYAARQWGVYNMDRWISNAEKKLGKPLPSTQDVTGKEPGQP